MREGAVLADEKFVLVRVIEAALAGGEALRNLNREADGFVDVRNMCGARRATGNLRLRRDGNADAGTRRRDARLQNRIDVVNIIPVRGNILLCKRQNLRQASRGRFENGEQIFARPQQVAILDGRRNGDAACVENAIAFGDGSNDIEMLQAVGIGVAMGNACDALKEVSDVVIGRVDEDGIYNFLMGK